MSGANRRFSLIVGARTSEEWRDEGSSDWHQGPWSPWVSSLNRPADEEARRSYFLPPVADTLVGSAFRQHLTMDGTGQCRWVLERWDVPGPSSVEVFVAHVVDVPHSLGHDWASQLEAEAMEALVDAGVDPLGTGLSHRVVFEQAMGSEEQRRARAFALATDNADAGRFGPDVVDELCKRSPSLSDDWTCITARDGTAFVADDRETDFLRLAPWLVSTIYVDICMLAVAQAAILTELTERLAAVSPVVNALPAIREIESDWSLVRHRLWWTRVARSHAANELMQGLQTNMDSEATRTELHQDLVDYARIISIHIAESEAIADRRLNRLVGVLTVLLGPAVVVDVIGTIIEAPSRSSARLLAVLLVGGMGLAALMTRRSR